MTKSSTIQQQLKSKIKSLLSRIQTKSKQVTPVDEASTAIGAQIADIFVHLYLEGCDKSSTTSASASASSSASREEWREQGYNIIHIFGGGNVNGGVVSGFFQSISSDQRILGTTKTTSTTTSRDSDSDCMHWWLQCINICETSIEKSKGNGDDEGKGDGGYEPGHGRESSYSFILHHCIRGYALYCIKSMSMSTNVNVDVDVGKTHETEMIVTDGSNDECYLASLYDKCEFWSTRELLIRECIHAAFHLETNKVPEHGCSTNTSTSTSIDTTIRFLAPITAIAIVSPSLASLEQRQMAAICLSLIMQESRLFVMQSRPSTEVGVLIRWLVDNLEILLESESNVNVNVNANANANANASVMAIGHDFTSHFCELCMFSLLHRVDLVANDIDNDNAKNDSAESCHVLRAALNHALNLILGKILPKFIISDVCNCNVPSLQPVLNSLTTVFMLLSSRSERKSMKTTRPSTENCITIRNPTLYNLASVCLMVQKESDVALILKILCLSMEYTEISRSRMGRGILLSLGHVFRSVSVCSSSANYLLRLVAEVSTTDENKEDEVGDEEYASGHVFDLFKDDKKSNGLISLLVKNERYLQTGLSIKNQCESLMLGLSMVSVSIHEDGEIPEMVYAYLNALISAHNHLGRRCLPILTVALEKYIQAESSGMIVPHLEFICRSISQDSSCAYEIWSIICSMLSTGSSISVQCMAIRLCPILCESNKRLYSRVHEVLCTYISHPNYSLRVSAAATICDLAKLDLIRDVTDVIGWLQTFLTDEEEMVVHFAIMSLYYLIEAEELDFAMVIKVLNKKLVQIDDTDEIIKLNYPVVKAVVQIMGTGEASNSSNSDDDSDDDSDHEIFISEQVQAATCGLRLLTLTLSESILNENGDQHFYKNIGTSMQVLDIAYESLSKYSFESIGIMNSGLSESEEYNDMKRIIELAFEAGKRGLNKHGSLNKHLVMLARRLVFYESDCLGPSLWNHSRKNIKKSQPVTDLRSTLEAVPMANEETLTNYLLKELVGSSNDPNRTSLSLALECLQVLSLPSEFVPVLEHVLDFHDESSNQEKQKVPIRQCIDSLIAQLSIERRSAAERREYARLSLSLSQMPSDLFMDLWKLAPQFLGSLGKIIPQWATSDAEDCIPKLWSNCEDKLSLDDGIEYAISFLKAMAFILDTSAGTPTPTSASKSTSSTRKISPTLVKAVHNTLVNTVFPSICTSFRAPSIGRVEEALYECIAKIPIQDLIDYNIFTFRGIMGADVCRTHLIAYLQIAGLFKDNDPYVLRAALWIGKQGSTREGIDDLASVWKASCLLASASATIPPTITKGATRTRSDIITTLFETLQVNGVNQLGLLILQLFSSMWTCDKTLLNQIIASHRLEQDQELDFLDAKDMLRLQLNNQQIGELCVNMTMASAAATTTAAGSTGTHQHLSSSVIKSSTSLIEAMCIGTVKLSDGENKLILNCLKSIYSSMKDPNPQTRLQRALISASLCYKHK